MLIRVLLVEDESARADDLRRLLQERLLFDEIAIDIATNIHDGAELLSARYFDLLILDIRVPMRIGEEPVSDGGVRLLRAIRSGVDLRLPGYIVGLTAYDDLAARYAAEFNESMWLIVQYDIASDAWIERLLNHVNYILGAQVSRNPRYDYDLAVVTALHSTELESVLALNGSWHERKLAGDDALYHFGTFNSPRGSLRVVATACLEMGMSSAAVVSMKLIEHFRPRYLAMTGIAAGVVGNFGDVLIADQSWDYGSGKTKTDAGHKTKFLPAPTVIQLDPALKYRLNWFVSRRLALERIRGAWNGRGVPRSLMAHIGPIASGASVVQSEPLVRQIESHNRKVIGVEMETYGLFLAARLCTDPRPRAMSFKSVCDFADGDKGDTYQKYAAFTSANFLYEFAIDSLFSELS
jgi:nucleoside phosphorylase/CheY-like chemotaxis protein